MKKEEKLVLIEELKNLNKLYKENKISINEAEKRFDDFYHKKYRDSYYRISDMNKIQALKDKYLLNFDDDENYDYEIGGTIYPLETFKDNEIKKEIMDFFEKRNDEKYPKNLVIEHLSRIGTRSLCYSIMHKLNLTFNVLALGNISRFNFRSEYYNNNKNVNIFWHEAKQLIKNNFLEKILDRKDFVIKPHYERARIISVKDKLNVFLCDFKPFLYNIKDVKIINYVNKKCKFIKIDYEKIGKLYI
ncbi:MAG: hypothetical protein Q8872_02260 [Candidatus Phytoplasma australasiaticum]|nr:hypothetical protein [Candidatus Phytoplasma australasiaticum]MDV3152728.1 hypothetical protein [Candidatus Phytoplasma australasiaticum]MDV3175365.1 hypothetical protein [Candidatus Phytoplasma australasiaticum]MDV3180325.1 hypothetical protein [Candidatus Phytoplasma australasiaticum]MDV3191712.1 hypothetical protein [Candidatus Phytoplasma australasiaticum]